MTYFSLGMHHLAYATFSLGDINATHQKNGTAMTRAYVFLFSESARYRDAYILVCTKICLDLRRFDHV